MSTKNNRSVSKKIASTAGALIAISPLATANADIVYVDDSPVAGNVFAGDGTAVVWDVDGVGGADFELRIRSSSANFSTMTGSFYSASHYFYGAVHLASRTQGGAQLNGRGLISTTSYFFVSPLASNANIGPTLGDYRWGQGNVLSRSALRFTSSSFQSNYSSFSTANGLLGDAFVLFSFDNNYLGFRFDRDGSIYYGWAEVNITEIELTITRWAYENEAGVAIRAGAIPEPGSLALLAGGAAGLMTLRRRKQKSISKAV